MHNLSIFGTSSDAGKSTLTWVIGKLLQNAGYSIAPFKAQNVSNNAHVADDGSEISIAQHFQAKALGVPTSWHNNPVLLKSGRGSAASVIVRGKHLSDKEVGDYFRDIDTLKPAVTEAFTYLDTRYDIVIAEGAGSPVELNLMEKDLSNIFVAQTFDTKIILVADIEKGGVFASIYGVYHLLPEALRNNVIGVIINKFRGDRRFFDEGERIIEERFGVPVLGVLPFEPFNLGFEDSQSLQHYTQDCTRATRRVAVIAYPAMSNYTDFEPLLADEDVCVTFIDHNRPLEAFDCVILPGSKRVFEDLAWLEETGLKQRILEAHRQKQTHIVGICGGFEMLHQTIIDEKGIEAFTPKRVNGLGFIKGEIHFRKEKILQKKGDTYEIHHGISSTFPNGYKDAYIYGTFKHGLFIDDVFRKYEAKRIEQFAEQMHHCLDGERLLNALR